MHGRLRLIHSNDVILACEVDGQGPALVLAHGLGCGRLMWRACVRLLAKWFTVVTYDLRGHGDSDAPEDPGAYSEDIFVDDFRAVLDGLSIERAYIGGLSLGGGVALRMALEHPSRVLGLALAGVGSGSDDVDQARANAQLLSVAAKEGGSAGFADAIMQTDWMHHYVSRSSEAKEHLRGLLMRHPVHGMINTLQRIIACRQPVYELGRRLREHRVPLLPVVGEYDRACARPMRFISDAAETELVVIPRLGHLVPLEEPALFAEYVRRFAAKQAFC